MPAKRNTLRRMRSGGEQGGAGAVRSDDQRAEEVEEMTHRRCPSIYRGPASVAG
nr:MAG TPA: hypothetical protein [Caudoviricetes sp.]